MYKRKIVLTNNRTTPLALSNNFTNTFQLLDMVEKCETAQQFCDVANKLHDFNYHWGIDYDGETNTRLVYKDVLGNVHYLIAYKKEHVQQSLFAVCAIHNFDSWSYAVRSTSYAGAVARMKELIKEEVEERKDLGLEYSILEWSETNVTLVHADGYSKDKCDRKYKLEDCTEYYVLEVR